MPSDTINALRKYLKLFQDKGHHGIHVKNNVTVAEKKIVAVCLQLHEVSALPFETVVGVPAGLTDCFMPDFLMLFDFLLQQAKTKALDTDIHEGGTVEQVKIILSETVDVYHNLCTTGK